MTRAQNRPAVKKSLSHVQSAHDSRMSDAMRKRLTKAVDEKEPPSPDKLNVIMTNVHELQDLDKRMAKGAELMEQLKVKAKNIRENVLPSLMDEVGLKFLGLEGEDTITRDEAVYASIAEAKMPKAMAWLDAHDYGALVKSMMVIPVDRGNQKQLKVIRALLKKAKLRYEEVGKIHPQTLKAFVKESLEKGRKLCKEISVHVQPTVTFKTKKATNGATK